MLPYSGALQNLQQDTRQEQRFKSFAEQLVASSQHRKSILAKKGKHSEGSRAWRILHMPFSVWYNPEYDSAGEMILSTN